MKIHHLRSATCILNLGEHRLLVDPMLSPPGAMPGFKVFGGGRRANPLVPLPNNADALLAEVTAVVITHEHPDHLDVAGLAWIKQRGLPVWANRIDLASLRGKGLDVHELTDGALGMGVEVIPSRHGKGVLGWMMGPVAGYYFAHPDEPSVYLTGDSVLTEAVLEAVDRLQPQVVVAPAGTANMGIGGNILFSVDELVTLVQHAPGDVVLNHLEALDHCATTRVGLRERMQAEGMSARVRIPADGEAMAFERQPDARVAAHQAAVALAGPGFQKWLTAKFAGT